MKNPLLIIFLGLSLMGAGCSKVPTEYQNPTIGSGQSTTKNLSIEEAKAQGRFVNTAYGYSLAFDPSNFENLKREIKAPDQASMVVLEQTSTEDQLVIEIGDPEYVPNPLIKEQIVLPLEEFVQHLVEVNTTPNAFNPSEKIVSTPEETTFAGYKAYRFTVTLSFKSPRGERQLDKEQTLFVFEHGGDNVVVFYPSSSDDLKAIADSWVSVSSS